MLALLALLLTAPAPACLWDSDTLVMEQAGLPELTAVIAGRYDRLPSAYYEARLARASQLLEADANALDAYDDAAVSLDRLGRPTEAIALMERKAAALEAAGGDDVHRYRLLANMGTFHAHRWLASDGVSPVDLHQAIALIEAAIALNPDAHFGREAVQLDALIWLRDAPTLEQPQDLLSQPGLLGFDDWTSQTIAAVTRDEVDPALSRTIEGLSGLIVLGAAWESPDIHLALSRALNASGQSALAWMARLRTAELLRSGKRFRQPTDLDADVLLEVLLEESMQITRDADRVELSFREARAQADTWREAREAWVLARLAEGRHPDTDPDFWIGAP